MRRLLPLVAVGLVASACTGGDDSVPQVPDEADLAATTSTTTSTTSTTVGMLGLEAATLEFTSCMRDQGVDFPDIRLDSQGRPVLGEVLDGLDTAGVEFRGALATCASILTQAGALDLRTDPELQAIIVDQLQQFSECMREQGVTAFPDPAPGFNGTGSPFPLEQIPLTDPAFQEAAVACQDVLGSLGIGG